MNSKSLGIIEKIIAIGMLVYAIWFNLKLYHLEPTATTDPNDNNFQFALVDRANRVWEYADRECGKHIFLVRPLCHLSIMTDHWVPNWAQGYNLPFYYSHVPQIVIVGSYRIVTTLIGHSDCARQMLTAPTPAPSCPLSLFRYYHWMIYLLLCFFPISVFLALRVIHLPWLVVGFGALIATHISTDGLYGLDPPSFLWRGWGLSSQLYAMFFMPPALAYSWRFFTDSRIKTQDLRKITIQNIHPLFLILNSNFFYAVLFTILSIMGHLGLGVMTLLSIGILAIAYPIELLLRQESIKIVWEVVLERIIKLILLSVTVIFFLAYWILPTMMGNDFHNISFWDPPWKFDSYGWKETLIRFFNGDLFDFGRFQWFTLLTIIGALGGIFIKLNNELRIVNSDSKNIKQNLKYSQFPIQNSLFPFSLLLVFWILMYFGRTTWGNLINLIPSMSEFHISRFIVGVHLTGFFLAPIGFWWVTEQLPKLIKNIFGNRQPLNSALPAGRNVIIQQCINYIIIFVAIFLIIPPIYKQTTKYNELNDRLILQGNTNSVKIQTDINEMIREIRSRAPSRIYAGRGGSWGKNFKIAETEMFMYISNFGLSTIAWLPETWSPNSDTEQYFSEDVAKDYDLYNLRWVIAPPDTKPQSFYQEVKRGKNWVLYEVPTSGYFTVGTRNMAVVTSKEHFVNLVHMWIQSTIPSLKLFPQILFKYPRGSDTYTLPTIEMKDEVDYESIHGQRQNIFASNPLYGGDPPAAQLMGTETVVDDQIFKATVKVEKGCNNCYAILKQSYHPNWKATVDGKSVTPIITFPFFIGIPLATSGTHEIVVWYQPSDLKVLLLITSIFSTLALLGYWVYKKRESIVSIFHYLKSFKKVNK